MEIVTIVEEKVPSSKPREFEATYESPRQRSLSPGLVESSLLRNGDNREIYRIETLWQSREALDKTRRMTQTPKDIRCSRR